MGLFDYAAGFVSDKRLGNDGLLPDSGYNTDIHTKLQMRSMAMEEAKANSRAMLEKERGKYQTQILTK
jgi:hypothetical protein